MNLIKLNVLLETNKTRVEFINQAHIQRFYMLDNYVVIELINGVKLKICDITINELCDKFFS